MTYEKVCYGRQPASWPTVANISGREQDIVDRKTALKTAITPLRADQIW